jgi:flavin reductase (DIM6/NTAB) family NADH-FMN oxidoreductase RutF
VQMECVLRTTHEVKDSGGTVTCVIVIGEVVLMHVHEGVAGADWKQCSERQLPSNACLQLRPALCVACARASCPLPHTFPTLPATSNSAGKSPSGKLVVDINKYRPISRLGGNTYGRVSGLFDLPRPDRGPTQQKLQYTSTAS